MVLWQQVRHLRDWAAADEVVRGKLFCPATPDVVAKRRDAYSSAPELSPHLDVIFGVQRDPLTVDVSRVGAACESLASWALTGEHEQTAIELAETGALIDDTNPKLANLAGRLTRNAHAYDRSEIWFQRGISLALERRNVVERVWGHLGYGRLFQELGRVPGARKHLNAGSRLAYKHGPPSLAASAQHDLCALLIVRGHLAEAAVRARRALLWYPKNHPRLPLFAADVGLLLILARHYRAASWLLKRVLKVVDQGGARAAVVALAARASAGAGDVEEAVVLRRRAEKLVSNHPVMEPAVRWHLADSRRLLGDWDSAARDAESALTVALTRNDKEAVRLIRQLTRMVEQRTVSPPKQGVSGEVRDFVQQIGHRISIWSPRVGPWPPPWGEARAA
ncbi:hypothetical protein [Longimicrobium terrae]|uniref:Tetratricopeptide (TPR) repeat protein n=1 Tax=Longimicrobium terrae TaxID=1639882 RepID=A0A841H585_9BACT|nr:hypothetical protein [Longimicrobium terrae]MBB6073134.1 tetratricopeptide (TPR) repeat protein [Longimicrobium terrae]NNC30179.1 hypothetical protein [Longimicrobium terrae]